MNKSELIEELSARTGHNPKLTDQTVRIFFDRIKDDLLRFLLEARRDGRTGVGYGAAAKGNTLLNYAGIRPDLLRFVVDQNPAKQGRYLPGSRIPIVSEDFLYEARPDHVLILPWNLREEVEESLTYIRRWGATFAIAVPDLSIW